MHVKLTTTQPADMDYIKSQTRNLGPDVRIKLRGVNDESKWLSITPAQTLAVEQALLPDVEPADFNPITLSITCNTSAEALLLWCALGNNQGHVKMVNEYLTPEQQAEIRKLMQSRYTGGLYPVWNAMDEALRAAGIITA
jgi:hypothetical protein